MEWMFLPLKKYAQFSGRSRRKEFWLWFLFVIIASIILSVLDAALGLGGNASYNAGGPATTGGFSYGASARTSGGVLTAIFTLATLIPGIAVSVRRLHDLDRTGWWILAPLGPYLLALLTLVGGAAGSSAGLIIGGGLLVLVGGVLGIVLLVFYCLPGTQGPNRFGPDPLDPAGARDLGDVFR